MRHARNSGACPQRLSARGKNPDILSAPPQIEVVKTRAQVESIPGKKLGSFKIASQIARKEGLRGFYIGGLMTAVHDGISSGIFFCGCACAPTSDSLSFFERSLVD